jgi:hypothetical protein
LVQAGDKDAIRALHYQARATAIERAKPHLERYESRLIAHFATGDEVVPERIYPILREVKRGSRDELLFRYARLHWSIPVSSGYGRRLRFLVLDDHTDKLLGLFGLGDPVFALRARDAWIGWDKSLQIERLRSVMDAFVLGAVPPYSQLLCGKLVAMLATSEEVQRAFDRKYSGSISLIHNRTFNGQLALITTSSALGRSSLYNRLKFRGRNVFERIGFTAGSGEFHFSNGIYHDLLNFAQANCEPSFKNERWSKGWRNRREVVRKVLPRIGLSSEMVYHGVAREVFAAALGQNTREYLRGEDNCLKPYHATMVDLFEWFRERWLLPRAQRNDAYQDFDPHSLKLWS